MQRTTQPDMGLGEASNTGSSAAQDPQGKTKTDLGVEAGTKRNTKKHAGSGTKTSKTPAPKQNAPHRPWDQYQMGYPRFAAFISEDKDKSSTIYRRFERLAARNLLYLESELAELEAKQDELDEACQEESIEIKMTARSWKELRRKAPHTFAQLDGEGGLRDVLDGHDKDDQSELDSHPMKTKRSGFGPEPVQKTSKPKDGNRDHTGSRQRLLLAYKIRAVLKEYYEFMKLQSDILALSKPDRRSWKATRKIFKNYDPWARIYGSEMIGEEMMNHLDNEHKHDLCVLAPPIERDRLTKLLEGRLAWIFRKRTAKGSTYYVPEQRVKIFVTLFSIVAAAAFLIGAIVGLYLVKDPSTQLLMLGGFTIGFAGALGLLTNARRQDVFAATAAYAAVLVVFVSGSLSNTPSSYNNISQGSTGASTSIIASTITLTSATATTLTQLSTFQTTSTVSFVTTILSTSTSSLGQTQTSATASSSNAATGAIVGGTVGGVAILAIIALFWFLLQQRRRAKSSMQWQSQESTMQSTTRQPIEQKPPIQPLFPASSSPYGYPEAREPSIAST